jgi:hypothetical protein
MSRAFAVVVLTLTVSLAAPAAAPAQWSPLQDPKVKAAIRIWEAAAPVINAVLKEERGQSAEVQVSLAEREMKLVVATQDMVSKSSHWSTNKLGAVMLDVHVPCKVDYTIDLKDVKLTYLPGKKVLKVRWPGVEVQRIEVYLDRWSYWPSTTGLRFQSLNADVLSALQVEASQGARGRVRAEAEANLKHIEYHAREALRDHLQELAQKFDRDIEVQLELAQKP